jgi:hypothetical protein
LDEHKLRPESVEIFFHESLVLQLLLSFQLVARSLQTKLRIKPDIIH